MADQADQFDRLRAALVPRYRVERELGSGGMATVWITIVLLLWLLSASPAHSQNLKSFPQFTPVERAVVVALGEKRIGELDDVGYRYDLHWQGHPLREDNGLVLFGLFARMEGRQYSALTVPNPHYDIQIFCYPYDAQGAVFCVLRVSELGLALHVDRPPGTRAWSCLMVGSEHSPDSELGLRIDSGTKHLRNSAEPCFQGSDAFEIIEQLMKGDSVSMWYVKKPEKRQWVATEALYGIREAVKFLYWATPQLAGRRPMEPMVYAESMVDVLPEVISCPPVTYPEPLRLAGIEGHVLVEFVVNADSRLREKSIRALDSTHEGFEDPARDMIAECVFKAGQVRGKPVNVLVRMPLNFQLPPTPSDSGRGQTRAPRHR